jgi:hypothetical protein
MVLKEGYKHAQTKSNRDVAQGMVAHKRIYRNNIRWCRKKGTAIHKQTQTLALGCEIRKKKDFK